MNCICQYASSTYYDVIIFSNSFDEHLDQSGLTLSPKKCVMLQETVKYVGHLVSQGGIETDPDKIEKVRSWLTPTTTRTCPSIPGVCRIIS